MNPDLFAEVESAFHRVLSLPADDRPEAVETLKDRDPAVAREVERLLRASDETWQLGEWGSDLPEPGEGHAAASLPERIGSFRVVGELGRGGMGVVYLGERDDDEFHQRVALKVVQRGFDTEMLGRLRRERQILATLDHPNIARLVDGGSTEDGRPFFAMDHIEGRDLLSWCDERRLDMEARIRLFLDVCAAVQYAHRNLVIHRDLKPSNILVTDDGVPKLLDFGIAKLLAAEVTEAGGETRTGLVPMTPDYASPEQMLGEPLTTATDVYSLGIVLFQLLTGVHPYADRLSGPASLARLLHAANAPKASSRVLDRRDAHADEDYRGGPPIRSAQLAKTLRGDLDNILAMALRREPDRRYPSVAELADDLRRYLDLRPVHAHPESMGYRLGRFVRRQKLLAAAGVLVFASMSVGIAGTTWQARKAERARLAAEQQAELAGTVSSYLVEIFGEPDPGKHLGNEPKASDLLARGRERLDDLEGQPEVQAELALVIGKAYQQLGRHEEARGLYQRCLDLRRDRYEPPHGALVEALLYLADAESLLEDTDSAQGHLLGALGQQRRLGGDAEMESALLNDLGVNFYRQLDLDAAAQYLEEALRLRTKALGSRHVDTAQTLGNLAAVQVAQGAAQDAVEPMQRALEIFEDRLGPHHPSSLEAGGNLAVVLYHLGRVEEAIDAYESLIRGQRRVYGDVHPHLGLSLSSLGWIMLQADLPPEAAVDVLEEAFAILAATLGPGHESLVHTLVGRGRARAAAGDDAGAIGDFTEALSQLPETDDSRKALRVAALSGLGRSLAAAGDDRRAAASLCRALDWRQPQPRISGGEGRKDLELLADLLEKPGVDRVVPASCRNRLDSL